MCTFVLGTFPANAPLERMETRGRREFFRFSRVAPGTVASVLQPGEWFGRLTSRYCDCDTSLGTGVHAEGAAQSEQKFIERSVNRLRHKGWSRHRIERFLIQGRAESDRRAKAIAETHAKEAREWLMWLRRALEEVRVQHVGILVDRFDGMLDDAYNSHGKPIPSTRDIRLRDVDERFLQNLEEGVLYRIRR